VVGAVAAKMILVECNSDAPVSLAFLNWIDNSPDPKMEWSWYRNAPITKKYNL
jgi:hypothetical protein